MTRQPVKVNSFSDLKVMKQDIVDDATARAQRAADALLLKQQKEADANLFIKAAGAVKPLPDKRTAPLKKGLT
ncbi:MAG: hypothetical protein KA173_14520 [Rhodoferax sp.]|nr:hypothetical protein [Rhodoferax sp.]MBP7490534.1 hypothetical protein [Rhodoferax sp.]